MSEPLIAVAMSGGVDSSAVAGMLKRDGCNIVGMTMQLWNQRRLPELQTAQSTGRCCSLDDVYDARAVASVLGIPYYVVNFEDRFEREVVQPFVEEYLAGRTPVPCTLCNNHIKFDQFLEMADGVGAGTVATGHYARIQRNTGTGRWELWRGVDASKDQTYFLWGLQQAQLARTIFPVGELTKPEVRALAEALGIPTAVKPDSQEICFVPNGDYAQFIESYFREKGWGAPPTRGEIIDTDGQVLGEHTGVHHFTVGQRKGLRVARPEPLYVIATEPATQRVVVGGSDELLRHELTTRETNWISIAAPAAEVHGQVRIRHKHIAAPAIISSLGEGRARVRFLEPQRAVTPGQAAVFYDGERVLGGGWIE